MRAIPEGGTLVDTSSPAAVQAFTAGQGAAPVRVSTPAEAAALPPGTGRAVFAVPAEAHCEVLRERALRLVRNRCWSQHFEHYGPEGPE